MLLMLGHDVSSPQTGWVERPGTMICRCEQIEGSSRSVSIDSVNGKSLQQSSQNKGRGVKAKPNVRAKQLPEMGQASKDFESYT